ncbi:MAG: hypothetical protein NC483_01225 [Ruminococcus sp.]|nr:hypothetical protein [Ruminococcus sp.]
MKFKRNINSKKYFFCGLISVVVLTVTVTFITSKANYRMTASIPLTEGKVVSSPYDINVMAIYISDGDGNYQELSKETTMPSGYIINKENTYCCKGSNCKKENKDTNAIIETIGGIHIFRGISKGDKCFIYLDKDTSTAKTMSELLNTHYKYKAKRTSENKDFNVPYEETTYGMIFEAEDDDGTTYYFAGNPLDNWVEFGGYYWRIIRINGDGSIRIIYQGRTQDENGNKLEPQATGSETQVGISAFNTQSTDNAYVGFMYGTPNSDTYEATHQNINDSTIKKELDNWFINSNIKKGSSYFDKIDLNAGFCGDRQVSTIYSYLNGNGGNKKVLSAYGPRVRAEVGLTKPIYNCVNNSDLYTYNASTKGNKVLKSPVGFISYDEAVYAGLGYPFISKLNYLNTEVVYWTISPACFSDNFARVFQINYNGQLDNRYVGNKFGIRPVINLRSDVNFTGDGTISKPYKVI